MIPLPAARCGTVWANGIRSWLSAGGRSSAWICSLPLWTRWSVPTWIWTFWRHWQSSIPTCVAFYFQNCGKLLKAEEVRGNAIAGPDRFIRFGVNARFFNMQGTDDMLVDTLGMSTCSCPTCSTTFTIWTPTGWWDTPYSVASYLLLAGNPIQDGETVDGVLDGAHQPGGSVEMPA